jgi:hypothetical protein
VDHREEKKEWKIWAEEVFILLAKGCKRAEVATIHGEVVGVVEGGQSWQEPTFEQTSDCYSDCQP